MHSLLRSGTLLVALLSAVTSAVHTVEVRGKDFVDTVTNKRLMIVGVDYQPGGQAGYKPTSRKDALSDGEICRRDAALLQRLGVNTIRVYNVDPTINHDECASIFNAVGIYMIIDVNSPFGGESINRADPSSSYHKGYLARIFGVVENFKNYPNTLAFFAANEVMNNIANAEKGPPYIRAVQRDLKNYIAKHASRPIPVGYSAADVREILEDTWAYFQCAIDGKEDDKTRSDFFGLNSYSWCGGDATFETAGYNILADMFKDTTIPVFFSEYGCNEVMPRVFDEVASLYGPQMETLSGGLVYEYSQEESNYGLVELENESVKLRTDYDNLLAKYGKLDVNRIQSMNPSTTTPKPPTCSPDLISDSGHSQNFTIPRLREGMQDLIDNGVENAVVGKLVEVKETKVSQDVFGTDQKKIEGLEIRLLSNDGSNTPGQANASPKKPGSASTLTVNKGCGILLVSVFLSVLMFL